MAASTDGANRDFKCFCLLKMAFSGQLQDPLEHWLQRFYQPLEFFQALRIGKRRCNLEMDAGSSADREFLTSWGLRQKMLPWGEKGSRIWLCLEASSTRTSSLSSTWQKLHDNQTLILRTHPLWHQRCAFVHVDGATNPSLKQIFNMSGIGYVVSSVNWAKLYVGLM